MQRNPFWLIPVLCVFAAVAKAEDKALSDAELAAKGKLSTALVEIGHGNAYGSAFCIAKGFFLTNNHVVQNSNEAVSLILAPGDTTQKKITAKILRKDEELD